MINTVFRTNQECSLRPGSVHCNNSVPAKPAQEVLKRTIYSVGGSRQNPWLIYSAVGTAVPYRTSFMIFLSFPVCCLALLHTKHSLCLEWWLQPTGFRLGMKDRVAKYAESLGEREVGLDAPQRAGWRGQSQDWEWCSCAGKKLLCWA